MVERPTFNRVVTGSRPVPSTILNAVNALQVRIVMAMHAGLQNLADGVRIPANLPPYCSSLTVSLARSSAA